jgi:hypothetical protein
MFLNNILEVGSPSKVINGRIKAYSCSSHLKPQPAICPPTRYLKTEAEPASGTMQFKNT